jgi:phosphate-selective porin OprO and OprP
MPTLTLWRIAVVVVPATFAASVAVADDTTAPDSKEKQLEQRIDELERQLADVNRKLADAGTSKAGDDLNQRVEELERLARKNDGGMFAQWKGTTWLSNADGSTKIRFGGRIQNDWNWFYGAADVTDKTGLEIEDGTEFRRARLCVAGTIYSNVEFNAEYDFAGGVTKLRDTWIALNCSCMPRIQVGSMKEPFGLEQLTSDLYTNMIERHSADSAFAPSYNTGIQASDTCMKDKVSWAVGMFRDANDAGDDVNNSRSGDVNYTARVTGRPWVSEGGDNWVHIGGAASYREPSDDGVRFASKPEMHLAPNLVDTGVLASDQVMLYELESAAAFGAAHVQAEYYMADVSGTGGADDSSFTGWALQGGYFLTGEHRPYQTSNGTWGRVIPKKTMDCEGKGMGAWEVVGRWDFVNLNDGPVDGGTMKTLSFGVNWYLNPNTKVMLDWVHAHADPAGSLNGVEMRFQVDF